VLQVLKKRVTCFRNFVIKTFNAETMKINLGEWITHCSGKLSTHSSPAEQVLMLMS
jgi:hypothetical protein